MVLEVSRKRMVWIYTAPFFVMALVLLALFMLMLDNRTQTLKNRQVGKTNQAYSRTIVCISSSSPDRRTPQYVKSCYDEAERSTRVKIERYGDGK